MKTLRDQYIEALTKLGEVLQDQKRSSKSIVFSRKEGGYYYLGKSGSLRVGKKKAESIPVSKKFKEQLLTNFWAERSYSMEWR